MTTIIFSTFWPKPGCHWQIFKNFLNNMVKILTVAMAKALISMVKCKIQIFIPRNLHLALCKLFHEEAKGPSTSPKPGLGLAMGPCFQGVMIMVSALPPPLFLTK